MVMCCICGIEFGPPGMSFHKFPKNMNRKARWLTIIEKKIKNFTYTENSVICNKHFAKDCFIITSSDKHFLKSDSVPTIFNMPLRKRYIIQSHQKEQLNTGDAIASTSKEVLPAQTISELPESHYENPISETSTIVTENIDVKKICASISRIQRKTKFGTVQSGTVDIVNFNENIYRQCAHEKTKELKKKLKLYQQKCRRLQKKVTSLTLLIKHLQDKKLLCEDAAELLEVSRNLI